MVYSEKEKIIMDLKQSDIFQVFGIVSISALRARCKLSGNISDQDIKATILGASPKDRRAGIVFQ